MPWNLLIAHANLVSCISNMLPCRNLVMQLIQSSKNCKRAAFQIACGAIRLGFLTPWMLTGACMPVKADFKLSLAMQGSANEH